MNTVMHMGSYVHGVVVHEELMSMGDDLHGG